MSSITIFHFEGGSRERWLEVHDDGEITYWTASDGYAAMRHPNDGKLEKMTAASAKARWPTYAAEIDRAVKEVSGRKRQNSN
jgi:hypothetical protein